MILSRKSKSILSAFLLHSLPLASACEPTQPLAVFVVAGQRERLHHGVTYTKKKKSPISRNSHTTVFLDDNVVLVRSGCTSSNLCNNTRWDSLDEISEMGSYLSAHYSDRPVVVINEARSQTTSSLDFRSPSRGGETGLDYFLTVQNVKKRLRSLESDLPKEYRHLDHSIEGILWLQERPSASEIASNEDAEKLKHLIHDFRQEFVDPDLPFVIRSGEKADAGHMESTRSFDVPRARVLYCNDELGISSCSVDAIAHEFRKVAHGERYIRGHWTASRRQPIPTALLLCVVFCIAVMTMLLVLDGDDGMEELLQRKTGNIPLLFFASDDEESLDDEPEGFSQDDSSDCLDMLEAQIIRHYISDVP